MKKNNKYNLLEILKAIKSKGSYSQEKYIETTDILEKESGYSFGKTKDDIIDIYEREKKKEYAEEIKKISKNTGKIQTINNNEITREK